VLSSGRKFSSADMLGLEMDIYSELDHFVADKLDEAVDHGKIKKVSARAHTAIDILRDWNGQMSASSAAPTIASHARDELMRLLLEPKLGAAPADGSATGLNWKNYQWMMETVWLEDVLLHRPQRWLPPGFANYDELLAAAV
jgi:penicillin amidase